MAICSATALLKLVTQWLNRHTDWDFYSILLTYKVPDGDEACVVSSKEQYLRLTIPIPSLTTTPDHQHTWLVIAADISGSMTGSPMTQVKTALTEIICGSLQNRDVTTQLIVYNHEAKVVSFTPQNYEQVIGTLRPGGRTNFLSVFRAINEMFSETKENGCSEMIIVFLTDGDDTCNGNNIQDITKNWLSDTHDVGLPITLHSVGFSAEHDFGFLKSLCAAGRGDGMYRFCEPGDGPQVLKDKLQELFDFILYGTRPTTDITLTVTGDNRLVHGGQLVYSCVLPGEITRQCDTTVNDASVTKGDYSQITVECWLHVADPVTVPIIEVNVDRQIREKGRTVETVKIPCDIESANQIFMETAEEKVLWNLRIMCRNADILSTKLADVVTEKSARLDRMQAKLSSTPLFGQKISRSTREDIIRNIQEVQTKIDQMRAVLADYSRGETDSIRMMARAHDMRYQAKFSKSRRQRLMDKRVTKNLSHMRDAQDQLSMLTVDKQEVDNLSQESVGFHFCALSQDCVRDILLSGEVDDVMGFGLAVTRPEHVLDEPSLIRLQNISGTLVSRAAMLDALEYKIKIDGQLSAHGGFDFSHGLGVTTVGLGREPINAWLPLYVTRSHWDRVKVLLKPSLGYFCTLDPLGYDYKQMDVLFMVLGSMVGQLYKETVGEHQLKLLFAFHRTCSAVALDFGLVDQMESIVRRFLETPAGRTKDVMPNLLVLVGYILVLPEDSLVSIFTHTGPTRRLWTAMLVEMVRRTAGKLYQQTNINVINAVVDLLLRSSQADGDTVDRVNPRLVCDCEKSHTQSDIELVVKPYDPLAKMDMGPEIPADHNPKLDQYMETWAQTKCGVIRNKNQADRVSKAKRMVETWLQGDVESSDRGHSSCPTPTEGPEKTYTCTTVPTATFEAVVKLCTKLGRMAYPGCGTLLGCVAYVDFWLSRQPNFSKMDENGGIAPDDWIQEVKTGIQRTIVKVKDFEKNAEEDVTETPDYSPIVMATDDDVKNAETPNNAVSMETPSLAGNVPTTKCNHGDCLDPPEEGDDDIDTVDDVGDGDDVLDDDFEDEIDYTATHKKKMEKCHIVSIPAFFFLADPDIDLFSVTRAMLCLVIKYHSNSGVRTAIEAGQYPDIANTGEGMAAICKQMDKTLQELRINAVKTYLETRLWLRTNHCMVETASVWAFIGYLMCVYTERVGGVKDLLQMLAESDPKVVPLMADKVRILFLGTYDGHCVLARGNVYLPEVKVAKRFADALGQEVWDEIETEIRSHVQIHVYRDSDIPNRHSHCNSHPYIPNCLRRKLGMDLLKENQPRRRNTRIRSART